VLLAQGAQASQIALMDTRTSTASAMSPTMKSTA
jgi:hypothetical protein